MKIQEILKEKGLQRFLINTGLLVAIFIFLQLISRKLIHGIEIPQRFYTIQYTLLGSILIFGVVIFLLLIKERLPDLPTIKQKKRNIIFFMIIGLVFYSLFFLIKVYIRYNLELAERYSLAFISLRYFILILTFILFGVAIFSFSYIKLFIRRFKKELGISLIVSILLFFFSLLLQDRWKFLSQTITRILSFILSRNYEVVVYSDTTMRIGDFAVNIGKVCSGIESLLLFTVLYLFIFFLDYKKLNKKKMFVAYVPGIVGVFFVNILRIYILLLVGYYYSPDLAVGIFHTNLGWMFFVAYFFLFWILVYKWVIKDDKKPLSKHS